MPKIIEVLAGGDLRTSLCALRDKLAAQLDACDSPRDAALVSKELAALLARIDRLPGGEVKEPLDRIAESIPADELAKRRSSRRSGAAASPGS